MSYENLELENVFIPSTIASKKLMIILHGRGDSSAGFTMLPDFIKIDEMNYILFDAPFEYFSGYSWYQLPPDQLQGIEYSSKLLEKDLNTLFEEDFNAQESFLFGFSQGSLLTFEFGGRYAKTLAGYIGVSGYIYDAQKLLQEKSLLCDTGDNWLCTHGKQDNVLAFETSQEQVQTLQDGGWSIEFKSYAKDHSIDRDELEMIREWMKERL